MEQQRIPRPKGLTELAPNYKDNKEHIDRHIISHYINTGFTYCGYPMDINTFSQVTQIEPETITQAMIDHGSSTFNLLDEGAKGEHLRALFGMALKNSLDDRSRALQQYSVLAAAQGHDYVPFVSSEVNKALKLTMESTQGMLQVIRALAGGDTTNILIQNNNTNQVQANYLTTEKALKLMEKQKDDQALLLDEGRRESLVDEYNLNEMPEVQANKQQGIDVDREGLGFDKIATVSEGLIKVEDDEESNRDRHTNRRAKEEYDVDLDADAI